MGFAEAWRRRVLAAAGAGAAVPGLVVCAALVVGVGGGGLGGVGALSQVLEGPRIPGGGVGDGGRSRRAERVERDTRQLLASVGRSPARPAADGGPRSAVQTPAGGGGRKDGGGAGPGAGPGSPPVAEPPAPAPPSPPAPAPPAPPPSDPPSLVREVGDQVTAITDPVPIVGPPAGRVVDALVDAVDALPPFGALAPPR